MKTKNKVILVAIIVAGVTGSLFLFSNPAVRQYIDENNCTPGENSEYVPLPWSGVTLGDIYFNGVYPLITTPNFASPATLTYQWQYYPIPSTSVTMQFAFSPQSSTFNASDVERAIGQSLYLCNGTAKVFVFSTLDSSGMLFSVLFHTNGIWYLTPAPFRGPASMVDLIDSFSYEVYRYFRSQVI